MNRFWDKVVRRGSCWEWTAATTQDGYGQFFVDARRSGPRKCELAHRVSFRWFCNVIPEGMKVLHQCDNPRCVKPSHLFLGTDRDNRMDCIRKGRSGCTRLTAEQVRNIRMDPKRSERGFAQRKAAECGVAKSTVWRVLRDVSWAHLTTPT